MVVRTLRLLPKDTASKTLRDDPNVNLLYTDIEDPTRTKARNDIVLPHVPALRILAQEPIFTVLNMETEDPSLA
jgi:hypothetical protein